RLVLRSDREAGEDLFAEAPQLGAGGSDVLPQADHRGRHTGRAAESRTLSVAQRLDGRREHLSGCDRDRSEQPAGADDAALGDHRRIRRQRDRVDGACARRPAASRRRVQAPLLCGYHLRAPRDRASAQGRPPGARSGGRLAPRSNAALRARRASASRRQRRGHSAVERVRAAAQSERAPAPPRTRGVRAGARVGPVPPPNAGARRSFKLQENTMRGLLSVVALATVGLATAAAAQDPGVSVKPFDQKRGGSPNVHMLSHVVTHKGAWKLADVEMEQDPNRPYVYACGFTNFDVQIYDVKDPSHPKMVYSWTIENPELHRGIGAMDGKYFKIGKKYYYAQSYQFMQGTPDADLGAVIFDVTGLPDSSKVKVVARIRYPKAPGGFHNTFAYKHSDGRVLYFTTVNEGHALIYDLDKVVSGADSSTWLIGEVPNPTPFKAFGTASYHDFYVGYDATTHQDKFYGAGLGGYSVWDVSKPEAPKQLFTITGLGLDVAHTFTPSPDAKYAVTETEYQYTPLRVWDLSDGQSGKTQNLDTPISAWTADWRDLSHNHEVRWPYVFVSAYEDGLQIFDLKNPLAPKTDGHYYT